jgi:hypothetical protein
MLIVGCDYHPSVQQIAWLDTESGECGERRLLHSNGEAETFYRKLKEQGVRVRVGIEATGTRAGSSVCWRNWSTSCGSATRRRSRPNAYGSKSTIRRMPDSC